MEKRIEAARGWPTRGLYAIVDPGATPGDPERLAEGILAGGCALLQLRAKDAPDRPTLALARRLAARCRAVGVPFVIDDRADLAILSGADGLHLGQRDLPIAEARRIVGSMPIGCSTHSLEQVGAALEEGADLLGFGPVFPTRGKGDPDPVVGLDALAHAVRQSPLPVVAIGGISLERASKVAATGVAFGAVIGALAGAEDVVAAARALHAAFGGAPGGGR